MFLGWNKSLFAAAAARDASRFSIRRRLNKRPRATVIVFRLNLWTKQKCTHTQRKVQDTNTHTYKERIHTHNLLRSINHVAWNLIYIYYKEITELTTRQRQRRISKTSRNKGKTFNWKKKKNCLHDTRQVQKLYFRRIYMKCILFGVT